VNRYDPEFQPHLLAERGTIRERLVRGVLVALLLLFLASILAFLVQYGDREVGAVAGLL